MNKRWAIINGAKTPCDCVDVHANLNLDKHTCECPCHRKQERKTMDNDNLREVLPKTAAVVLEAKQLRAERDALFTRCVKLQTVLEMIVEAGRPHGNNDMVCTDGPCECDVCEAWRQGRDLLAGKAGE